MRKTLFFTFLTLFLLLICFSFGVKKAWASWTWKTEVKGYNFIDGTDVPLSGVKVYLRKHTCESGSCTKAVHDGVYVTFESRSCYYDKCIKGPTTTGSDGRASINGGSSYSCCGSNQWCLEHDQTKSINVGFPPGYTFPAGVSSCGHWEHKRGAASGSYERECGTYDGYTHSGYGCEIHQAWRTDQDYFPQSRFRWYSDNSSPTGSISGPTSGTVGNSYTFIANGYDSGANAGLNALGIYYSPTGTQSWDTIGTADCGGAASCTNKQATLDTKGMSPGTYYIVVNVYDKCNGKCSGNPWCPCPGYTDCGASDVLTFTLIEPTFTIQGYAQGCPDGTKIKLDGVTKATISQPAPYYIYNVEVGTHTVSLELPAGRNFDLGHSSCDCCTDHTFYSSGASYTFYNDTTDCNWYDLWWRCEAVTCTCKVCTLENTCVSQEFSGDDCPCPPESWPFKNSCETNDQCQVGEPEPVCGDGTVEGSEECDPPGETGSRSCTYCSGQKYCTGGTQSRTCGSDCQWGSWSSCSGGSCSYVCGECGYWGDCTGCECGWDPVCGTLWCGDCGAFESCVDCQCEPNIYTCRVCSGTNCVQQEFTEPCTDECGCEGYECGDNGCGGSCGECGLVECCVDHQCVERKCTCRQCVAPYDCDPAPASGGSCNSSCDASCNCGCASHKCDIDDDCPPGGCGNGDVESPEECDPPGSTSFCTMPDGCPGIKTCQSNCLWGSCEKSCAWGYCPQRDCGGYCPSPQCTTYYTCGYSSCSTNCDCGQCSPGSWSGCGSCSISGCPGQKQCNSSCCWGSCYRSGDSYCCSSGQYCPHRDCYGGDCQDSGARGCGTDQCLLDAQCQHCVCDESACGGYCDANCNCSEENCRVYLDDTAGVADECGSILWGCGTGDSDCCEPSCSSPYCGQDNGCGSDCDDCDFSDDNPLTGPPVLTPPENLTGSSNPANPGRVRKSKVDVLDSNELTSTLDWDDGDLGNGCGGSSRSDKFPIRIDNLDDSWDCANPNDECSETAEVSYDFTGTRIGTTYKWWVHARNDTCDAYGDCCGNSYNGTDDWSDASLAYICRPDCRPKLCGQNDGCGAEETLTGFNGFDGKDDDCYWDENNNPAAPSHMKVSLDIDPVEAPTASGLIDDPTILEFDGDQHKVYFFWNAPPLAQDTNDEFKIEIWDAGDPVTSDPGAFDWTPSTGSLKDGSLLTYSDACSAGSCDYPLTGTFEATKHHIYAFRIAAHNTTCETIDATANKGTGKGQVDTVDPDGCSNTKLCDGDGNGECYGECDWSTWAEGYFIIDQLPEALEITPTCSSRGGDCWSGSPDGAINPENDQSVWPWKKDEPDGWIQPWDDRQGETQPQNYCDDPPSNPDCVDMVSQNNPVVFEVIYSDPDGWDDLKYFHFTVTKPGQDCRPNPWGNKGWVRLERTDPSCDGGVAGDSCISSEDSSDNDWKLVSGRIEKLDDGKRVKGYFKIQFNPGTDYGSHGGEIKTCADADDFHTAGDETTWTGNSNWDWKVDLREPEVDASSTDPQGGNEVTNLLRVDVDGDAPSLYCDPETKNCPSPPYDTWAFEVKIALRDFEFDGKESKLAKDTDSDKLALDANEDGIITFDEREDDTEENEYSALAWYHGDYNDDGAWKWIRLSSDPGEPFHYETSPGNFDGRQNVTLSLFVPAEDETNPIGGISYQRTKRIRVQVRDRAGNTYDSGENLVLYPGWFQAINGDAWSRGEIYLPIDYAVDENTYDRYFLASEPSPPPTSTPDDTSGGIVLSGPETSIDTNGMSSERDHDGAYPQWESPGYKSSRLSDWDSALGFDWGRLRSSASDSWDGNDALSPGQIYTYEPATPGAPLAGSYNLNKGGVAVVYVDGDLAIGDGTSHGVNATFRSNDVSSKGIILVVEGNVTIRRNITRIDAFIISKGEIIFELGKATAPLEISGGLIAKEGFDVSRYIFDVYKPVFRVHYNPLYISSTESSP